MKNLRFIASFFRPYWWQTLLVVLLLSVEVAFYSFFTYSIQYIITAVMNRQIEFLIRLFLFLFIGALFSAFCSVGRCFVYSNLSSSVIRDIRMDVFRKIEQLSIGQLVNETSKLQTRFQEVDLLGEAFVVLDKSILYSLLSSLSCLILLITINIKLFFIALLLIPFLFLIPGVFVPKINAIGARRDLEENLSAVVLENILMQPVIRIFGLQERQERLFANKNFQSSMKYFRIQFFNNLVVSSADLMPIVLRISVFAVGSYFVFTQNFNIASLISFEFIFSFLIYSVIRIFYSLSTVTSGYAALQSIQKFLEDQFSSEIVRKKEIHKKITSPTVNFNDVCFGYDPKNYNLHDLNFEIPYKTYVAFVGPNGAGKTTIINLILNFFKTSSGSIKIDGINIDHLAKKDLYKVVGYVPQNAMLFNASIRENIQLGKHDATQEEIELASKKADLHAAVEQMPNKYNTVIGEMGMKLSGGQKQRLSLARALIRSPQVLLLDETTSALDSVSEAAINKTIAEIAKNCTVIVITHRLSSIIDANCIYVLNKGVICEYGSHGHLIEKKGIYHELWDKQHGFIESKLGYSIGISIERLKKIPLFSELSEESLETIRNSMIMMAFPENVVLFREGDIGDIFYIIMRGKVEVSRKNKPERKDLIILDDGDYFGEIALLKSTPRTATVKTSSFCTLLALHSYELNKITAKNPIIKERLEKRMSLYR